MARRFFGNPAPTTRWPCVHCGATTHYPENCLFRAQSMSEPPRGHIHHLHQLLLEDNTHHSPQVLYPNLDNSVTEDQQWHSQGAYSHNGLTTPSTIQSATVLPVTSYTSVKYVEPTIVPGSVPTGTVPLSKPTPWTPLRPFILKHELSNHADQTFIKQLIKDLFHDCFIGYKGPQFSYSANNLVSAYQHPTTIDTTLYRHHSRKGVSVRMHLRTIQYPPLPNFWTSELGLVT